IDEQTFEDYKSKYLDIHDKVKNFTEKEKVSILDDVDFELELIHRDEINVAYILRLLSKLHESEEKEKTKQREEIINLLGGEAQLRSKKELIEKFIDQNLPKIYDVDEIPEAFALFWDAERQAALDNLCEEEQLILEEVKTVIENYLFTSRRPLRDSIVATLKEKPKILERKTILERVTDRIMAFVGLFDEGMGGV
ncbi:MAG: type I restriction endonuclease subunit R, partial [Lewinella sp.]|nr:type I restriction endonuclease subunit R [Lewinella sp.]